MTKIFNFALKIKGVVGRVAGEKSSDPATPQNLERALRGKRGVVAPWTAEGDFCSLFLKQPMVA